MNKKDAKKTEALIYKDCFYLHVDGTKYGPFLDSARPQYKDLNHRQGVRFEPVRLARGWVTPPAKLKAPKKDDSMPLLAGVDFMPTAKRGR